MSQGVLFQPEELSNRVQTWVALEQILPSPEHYPMYDIPTIATQGVLQPVLLSPENEMYRIVAGHRRVFNARKYGHLGVPALLTEGSEAALLSASAVTNLSRKANTVALLEALRTLLDQGHDLAAIAALWGVPLKSLEPDATLLRLPPGLLARLGQGLSLGVARRIAHLKDPYLSEVAGEVERIFSEQATEGRPLRFTHDDYLEATCARAEDLGSLIEVALDSLGTPLPEPTPLFATPECTDLPEPLERTAPPAPPQRAEDLARLWQQQALECGVALDAVLALLTPPSTASVALAASPQGRSRIGAARGRA